MGGTVIGGDAMIKISAPDGYKLKDIRTGRLYSEVVTEEKNRDRYELVPDTEEKTIEYIGG